MSKFEKILLLINFLLYLFLAVFSYAYVDLNLTISKNPLILNFVNFMQQLGYFNRSTATLIYLIFMIFTFSIFILNLWLFYRSKVGIKYLATSTVLITGLLVFAYPFLSADLFNYLFDAKIILTYHSNPYTHRPLDFPSDEWLRFMRWVHRYSPYGPLWLGMSLVPAVLGFGKFFLNLLAFKIFIGVFHLINSYLIFKILKNINSNLAIFGTAFYSLNPLFLLEGVANAHNDIILATTMLASIYFFVYKRTVLSYVFLAAGTGIKYIPILNLPWLLSFTIIPKIRNSAKVVFSSPAENVIILSLVTMAIFTYIFSSFRITVPFVSSGATQVQFQPWYLFWTIPLVSVVPFIPLVSISTALTFGASLRYLPFLYYGDWSHLYTVEYMKYITLIFPVLVLFYYCLKFLKSHSENFLFRAK